MNRVFVFAIIFVFLGVGCGIAPGSQHNSVVRSGYFPDTFKAVDGSSLPRAIAQAYESSRESVRVSMETGESILLDISEPTHVVVTMSGVDGVDLLAKVDEIGSLKMPIYNEEVFEDGSVRFFVNEFSNMELSKFIYEMFIRVYGLVSTQDWIIQLQ